MTGRLRLKPSPRNSRRRRKRGLRRRRIWNALDQNPCFRHILAGEALDCHSIPSTMSSLWRGSSLSYRATRAGHQIDEHRPENPDEVGTRDMMPIHNPFRVLAFWDNPWIALFAHWGGALVVLSVVSGCRHHNAARPSPSPAPPAQSASPAQPAEKPYGLSSRAIWTVSKVHGTPEPPEPLVAERRLPKIKFYQPLDIEFAPGGNRVFVLEQTG